MKVYSKEIAGRKFLILEDVAAIPMDRIKHVDFKAPNGGASDNSVRIHTDDDEEDWTFAYHNADAIRNFFTN